MQFAQTSIAGKISDKDTGEDMISTNIIISQNGIFIGGATTDIDGNYKIEIDSGKYDMEVSYTGYPTQKITGIVVIEGQPTKVDVQLNASLENVYFDIVVTGMTIRIITPWDMLRGIKVMDSQIQYLPTRNIFEMSTLAPGVSFTQ